MRLPLLTILCAFLLQSIAVGQGPVWKISKDDRTLYLGGTCHLLRKSDFPLPQVFDTAYKKADLLVFEVEPGALEDPAVAMQLMQKSRYTDGRSLRTELSEEVYAEFAAHCKEAGMPIEILNSFKPGMAIMMVTIHELMKAGVTEEGVDIIYGKKAKRDGKPVKALETAAFQIDMIVSIGEGQEDAFVRYSLSDLDQVEKYFDDMVRAWREGDFEAMDKVFVEDMRQFPGLYEALLKDRNEAWMKQLEKMLVTADVELVLVGAGHLVGEDGLLKSFKDLGCTVEALPQESSK